MGLQNLNFLIPKFILKGALLCTHHTQIMIIIVMCALKKQKSIIVMWPTPPNTSFESTQKKLEKKSTAFSFQAAHLMNRPTVLLGTFMCLVFFLLYYPWLKVLLDQYWCAVLQWRWISNNFLMLK